MTDSERPVRKSVPLDKEDMRALTALKCQGSDDAVALHSLTGIAFGDYPSEAERLHALIVAGRLSLAQRKTEIGYRRLAEFVEDDPETIAWRTSRRTRAIQRHAQEQDVA